MIKNKPKFDYSKLKGLLVEKGLTRAQYAQLIGISSTVLTDRLQGRVAFTQTDIYKTKQLFNLSENEVNIIFFTTNQHKSVAQ